MRAMGDKMTSKRLAQRGGVPTLPGSDGAVAGSRITRVAAAEADRLPGAGQGQRGRRRQGDADRAPIPTSCAMRSRAAGAEAAASFGDGRVFVERFIERPRHIEVQVLADGHGTVLHLGERECSIQRRYQKVIEESPSPFVDAEMRAAMGSTAVALARPSATVSAGTVEMIADAQVTASTFSR